MKTLKISHGLMTKVDDDVFEMISGRKYHASKSGATHYAVRHEKPSSLGKVKLHHEVIGRPPAGMVIDHIDGDGLNNTRENLRVVSVRQNQQNQIHSTCKKNSKYPGVTLWKKGKHSYWVAGAKFNGRRKTIGYFSTEEEAYAAYLSATSTGVSE